MVLKGPQKSYKDLARYDRKGSRVGKMVEAEQRVLSEYSEELEEDTNLPAITPELLKSRRTHSLQLALGDILNNKASVQTAASKYQIPRETLRRHFHAYQAQQHKTTSSLLTPRGENTTRGGKETQDKWGENSNKGFNRWKKNSYISFCKIGGDTLFGFLPVFT